MMDHLSPGSTHGSSRIVPIHFVNEEQGLHTLWRRFQIPERSSWKSFINRLFKPLDWGLDHLIDGACKISPFVAEQRQNLSIKRDCRFTNFMAGWSIESARSTAEEWSSMSEQRLASCRAMLDWTNENVSARYKACLQRSEQLDLHAANAPKNRPCPRWQPDPEICEYLNWARLRAEQIDEGISSPAVFILQPLDCAPSGDLVIGLEILSVHFEIKQMERAVTSYIRKFNLARTIAKIGLVASTTLMRFVQERLAMPFSLSLLGLFCFGGAWLLCIKAHAQFQADRDRMRQTSNLFYEAVISVYRNFATTRERNERRTKRANADVANAAYQQVRAEQAESQIKELKVKLAESTKLLNTCRQLSQDLAHLKNRPHLHGPLHSRLMDEVFAGNIVVENGKKIFSPSFLHGLTSLALASRRLHLEEQAQHNQENEGKGQIMQAYCQWRHFS